MPAVDDHRPTLPPAKRRNVGRATALEIVVPLCRCRVLAERRHAPSLALIPLLIMTIRVTARAETEIDLWSRCSEVRCDRVDGGMLVGADQRKRVNSRTEIPVATRWAL